MKAELQQVRQFQHGVSHFIAFVQVMTITDFLLLPSKFNVAKPSAYVLFLIAGKCAACAMFFYLICMVAS